MCWLVCFTLEGVHKKREKPREMREPQEHSERKGLRIYVTGRLDMRIHFTKKERSCLARDYVWGSPGLIQWEWNQGHVVCVSHSVCPTLGDPMDCRPPRLLCPQESPGKNIEVDGQVLLQGIFPTQVLYLGLLHCRWTLYHLRHKPKDISQCLISHQQKSQR